MADEILLIRHGETAWSRSGQHTGRTDLPLLASGEEQARDIGGNLATRAFALVLTSPLDRSLATCRLAGLGDAAILEPDLMEWDYGDYEGLTTPDIRESRPDWHLFADGVPGGEGVDEVGARADRVIARVRDVAGSVALFGHGHILRVLAARWVGLPPPDGRLFSLSTASISVLGFERETPVIRSWNDTSHIC